MRILFFDRQARRAHLTRMNADLHGSTRKRSMDSTTVPEQAVIPAKAGIHCDPHLDRKEEWISAAAAMTPFPVLHALDDFGSPARQDGRPIRVDPRSSASRKAASSRELKA
jgi:hypothetical protein